jgi:hypothetical protein
MMGPRNVASRTQNSSGNSILRRELDVGNGHELTLGQSAKQVRLMTLIALQLPILQVAGVTHSVCKLASWPKELGMLEARLLLASRRLCSAPRLPSPGVRGPFKSIPSRTLQQQGDGWDTECSWGKKYVGTEVLERQVISFTREKKGLCPGSVEHDRQ